jgi:hypothetical protein
MRDSISATLAYFIDRHKQPTPRALHQKAQVWPLHAA